MKIIYELLFSQDIDVFLEMYTKREWARVLSETIVCVCVCTRVGGLISVLALKVVVHQGFSFCTCHKKRPS